MDTGTPPAVGLANTLYAVRGRVREGIDTWLETHDLADDPRLRELRDAIRTLFDATIAGAAYPPEAVAVVNRASAAAPRWPELTPENQIEEHTGASAADAALAGYAQDAVALLGGPGRETLRSCQAPGCVQFFVKTHPRQEFCGPACGNRARAARHYQRHKGE